MISENVKYIKIKLAKWAYYFEYQNSYLFLYAIRKF